MAISKDCFKRREAAQCSHVKAMLKVKMVKADLYSAVKPQTYEDELR